MATIWKRKTGQESGWTARVRRAGHSVSKTFRTRREAEAWAANIERDIETRRAGIARAVRRPFADAIRRYRSEVSEPPLSQVSRPKSPPPRTRRVTDEEIEQPRGNLLARKMLQSYSIHTISAPNEI